MQLLKFPFASDVFEVVMDLVAQHLHLKQLSFGDGIQLAVIWLHANGIVWNQ